MRLVAAFLLLVTSSAFGIEPRVAARTEAKRPTSYTLKTKSGTKFNIAAYEETKTEYRVRLINGIGTSFKKDTVLYISPQYARTSATSASEVLPPTHEAVTPPPKPHKDTDASSTSESASNPQSSSVSTTEPAPVNEAFHAEPSLPVKTSLTDIENQTDEANTRETNDFLSPKFVAKTGTFPLYRSRPAAVMKRPTQASKNENTSSRTSSSGSRTTTYRSSARTVAKKRKPRIDPPAPPVETQRSYSGSSSGEYTATGIPIHTGPRGGKFHYSASGKKVYEKKK